jgi:hypothetical protein
MVREGDRSIWRIDGDTTGDNTLFATEGVFVP